MIFANGMCVHICVHVTVLPNDIICRIRLLQR
jgi:hypothetical protein